MAGAAKAASRVLVMTRIAAPRAVLLIEDGSGGELPPTVPGQLVAASATSIAVGCSASDATEVTIGNSHLAVGAGAGGITVFDGTLATPTRTLAVRTVLGATLLEVVVPSTATRVRIGANAGAEPTALTIAVARAAAGVAR